MLAVNPWRLFVQKRTPSFCGVEGVRCHYLLGLALSRADCDLLALSDEFTQQRGDISSATGSLALDTLGCSRSDIGTSTSTSAS